MYYVYTECSCPPLVQGSAWRAWKDYVQQRAHKTGAAARAVQHWRAPCLRGALQAWRWFLSDRRQGRAVCSAVVARLQHRHQVPPASSGYDGSIGRLQSPAVDAMSLKQLPYAHRGIITAESC